MKLGRNDPCPCGSGKKYKQCCLGKDEDAHRLVYQIRQEQATSIFENNLEEMLFDDWHFEAENETEDWDDDDENDWDEEYDGEWEREARLADEKLDDEESEQVVDEQESETNITLEETEWRRFFEENLEGKIAYFEDLLEKPEPIEPEDALNLLEEIFEATLQENARERYEEVIEKFHRRSPEAYHATSFAYLDHRISNALVLGNEAALASLVDELAVTDVDAFEEVLYSLAYYVKLDVINAAMPLACPRPDDSAKEYLWDPHLASVATRYLAFAQLERQGMPQPGETAWYEPFLRFSKIPADRLLAFMALLSGQEQRHWLPEHFHVPIKRRKQGERSVAQNLFELTLQFQAHARGTRALPFCKSELGREQLHNYILRRACGELFPSAFARRDSAEIHALRKQMHPEWPPHARLLCPDRVTLRRYLEVMMQHDASDYYLHTALFELLPEWLNFLVAQQLLEPAQRDQTLLELHEAREDVLKLLRSYARDPNLYQNLSRAPWPHASAEQALA